MFQFTQPGKRRGLFGSRPMGQSIMPGDQPDFGMGDFPLGRPSALPGGNPGEPMEAPAQQRAKPHWAGIAADFLSGLNGQPGQYAASLHAERERADQAAQYQRQRMDKRDDWMWQQDYERANPKPVNNDTTNDLALIEGRLGREAGDNYLRRQADPDVTVPLPNGQIYIGPRSGMAAALGAKQSAVPQPGAVVADPRQQGGAAPAGARPFAEAPRAGFAPPMRLGGGAMTSGRRTPEGNALVGGVPNSAHLRGEAVDYDGPDLNKLLAEARKLPGIRKAFIHDGHVHTEGKGWSAPYFGRRGTKGLKR